MTGHYEKEHFFAFLSQGEVSLPTVIANLQQHVDPRVGPIYLISTTEGDFPGFAHIALDDTLAMAAFIDTTLWDAGLRGTFATEGQWYEFPPPPPTPKGPPAGSTTSSSSAGSTWTNGPRRSWGISRPSSTLRIPSSAPRQ